MLHQKKIFLSKNGKTFGPFSETEIDDLQEKGELEKFNWICRDPQEGWRPTTAPPSLPVIPQQSQPEKRGSVPLPSTTHATERWPEDFVILAVCHDFKTILSGSLKDFNTEGCTLTHAIPYSKSMPLFHSGTSVLVNLLDSHSTRSENVYAKIVSAIKNEGFWDYRLRWEKLPLLLVHS